MTAEQKAHAAQKNPSVDGMTVPERPAGAPDRDSGRDAARNRRHHDTDTKLRNREKMLPQPDGHSARAVPPGMEPPGMKEQVTVHPAGYERVLTIPNLLSLVRILLVPVYAWALIGPRDFGLALGVVIVSSITDWLDGKIARIWGLTTRIGQYLDPAADRLFVLVTPICFALAGLLSWWWVVVLFARDLVLLPTLLVYRSRNVRPQVMYVGKAATFALMWAFPLYLASATNWGIAAWCEPFGQALFLWGTVLYVWTAFLYVYRAVLVAHRMPRVA